MKFSYAGNKLHILGSVSISVQCVHNGRLIGNHHIRARVVSDFNKTFDTHCIGGDNLKLQLTMKWSDATAEQLLYPYLKICVSLGERASEWFESSWFIWVQQPKRMICNKKDLPHIIMEGRKMTLFLPVSKRASWYEILHRPINSGLSLSYTNQQRSEIVWTNEMPSIELRNPGQFKYTRIFKGQFWPPLAFMSKIECKVANRDD